MFSNNKKYEPQIISDEDVQAKEMVTMLTVHVQESQKVKIPNRTRAKPLRDLIRTHSPSMRGGATLDCRT